MTDDNRSGRTDIQSVEELEKELDALIEREFAPYRERLSESFKRVTGLVASAAHVASIDSLTAEDMLRAVVVLNHAYLEDVLRTLARGLLPLASEEVLNQIPLLGGSSRRAEKFFLGKLAHHKGRSVEEIIRASVSEYLERSNYNNTEEISILLEDLGFSVADHNGQFSKLDAMMQRRHQIVHRADRVKPVGSDNYVVAAIDVSQVQEWLRATKEFTEGLMVALFKKQYPAKRIMEMFPSVKITE